MADIETIPIGSAHFGNPGKNAAAKDDLSDNGRLKKVKRKKMRRRKISCAYDESAMERQTPQCSAEYRSGASDQCSGDIQSVESMSSRIWENSFGRRS